MAEKKPGKRHCCYGQCRSDERYPDKYAGVTFLPFPKPKRRLEDCKAWIKACGRPHDQLNPSVITKHFVEGRTTVDYPYPLPYDGRPVQRGRKRKSREMPDSQIPSKRRTSLATLSVELDTVEPCAAATSTDSSDTRSLDLLTAAIEIRGLQEENAMLRKRVQHLEAELKKLKEPAVTTTSNSTRTEETKSNMTDSIRNSKIKNLFQSYTGLTFVAFTSLFNFLVPNENPVVFPRKRTDIQKLLVRDQLLLVLMRLRGGFFSQGPCLPF